MTVLSGPIAAKRLKSFSGRSDSVWANPVAAAWGDNPKMVRISTVVEIYLNEWAPLLPAVHRNSALQNEAQRETHRRLQMAPIVAPIVAWSTSNPAASSAEHRLSDLPQSRGKDDRSCRPSQGRNDEYLRLRPAHGPGRTTAPAGMVLGHEITGEVIEKGHDVEYLEIGDLVSVPFNVACGRCRTCREGDTGRLPSRQLRPPPAAPMAMLIWADGSAGRPTT